ncbi:MAG: ketohydroxyglutarate aldolase [Solirubrobacteraceae bacterium]
MALSVTITVADTHRGEIDEVAERLRAAGMEVERVLAAIGVITGAVDQPRLAELAAVVGVAGVQEQASFRLAPPDADVQ